MKQRILKKLPVSLEEVQNTKIPITHWIWAKMAAFVGVIFMVTLVLFCVVAAIVMCEEELYTVPEEEYQQEVFSNLAKQIAATGVAQIQDNREQDFIDYCIYKNVVGVTMRVQGETDNFWVWGTEHNLDYRTYKSVWCYHPEELGGMMVHSAGIDDWHKDEEEPKTVLIEVSVYIATVLTQKDDFYMAYWTISVAYAMRYWIYVIGILSGLIAIGCFVFLMCSSGWRNGAHQVQAGWGTFIPIDLLSLETALGIFLGIGTVVEAIDYGSGMQAILMLLIGWIITWVIGLGWCMSMALRIKLGTWWKNSILWQVWRGTMWVVRKMVRKMRTLCTDGLELLCRIPLVWKTTVLFIGVSFWNIVVYFLLRWYEEVFIIYWFLTSVILFFCGVAISLMLQKLQRAGDAMASGDLSYQVDTRKMIPCLKRHGENLNRIGEGMTVAVNQRMKSERMKTELVTNVSHDIKTPLTSIINYADLIGKEPCENKKITEYASVLYRQSERLKRLIEDLVEASKASTGNLEVQFAPCELGILFSQTEGEYTQRLQQNRLDLIIKQPKEDVKIMADGRRMWRIFDNLMENICKYSQPGTRVYLTLEEVYQEAVISFKNMSYEPLNLTADELTERFVRGDTARNSEGNGLGLSIAKSLTELQGGKMEISVDGDLFKVVLRFPKLS